jgi:cation diffusion facilitator family transporter
MSNCDCSIEVESREQSRVLIVLLAINAVMFAAEIVAGLLAESTGLIADSLDMLADAAIYGIGLYAVGKAMVVKVRAAFVSGYFQIALALIVALDIARRAVFGSEPDPGFMVIVSVVALTANVICLLLLAKHRDGEVHMRASWIFSRNDVIANAGVILGGLLVYGLGSRWPDLIVGLLIVTVVFRGGLSIIADARLEQE